MLFTVPSRMTPSSSSLRVSSRSVSRSCSRTARRDTTTLARARLYLRTANLPLRPTKRSRSRTGRMSTCEPGRNSRHADIDLEAALHLADDHSLHCALMQVRVLDLVPHAVLFGLGP